jgi:chorismate mutase
MNSSGSEFALRVALCDLIERLKRCEQKCSYLEQCRNHLIKEVMRLRKQNDFLSTQTTQLAINESNNHIIIQSNNNNFDNNLIIRSVNELKDENKTIEYDMIGNNSENKMNSNTDESWEEITVRLIRDLRRDVTNGQALNDEQRYGLETCDELNQNFTNNSIAINDKIESIALNDDYDRIDRHLNNSNNNSVVRNSVLPINGSLNEFNDKSDKKVMKTNNTRQQINQIKKLSSLSNETNLSAFDDLNNCYLSKISEKNKMKTINNSSNGENGYSNLFESNAIDNNNSERINAFCSAIYYVKKDLNDVLQALTAQNDKLNRLKAKQLRNFFQRQINFDQNFHQTITPLSPNIDQKSNENY